MLEKIPEMTLRITILTLIATLLTATVVAIGWLGYYFTKDSVENLKAQYLQAISEGTAKGIDSFIQVAYPLLSSVEIPENLKPEITNDERELVRELEGHMKTHPEFTYLNYGNDADGHYIAVRRDPKLGLIFNRAHQEVGFGHEYEWSINSSKNLIPLPQPETPPYDPRTREWYQLAKEKGFIWTKPYYLFSSKELAISAGLPVKSEDGQFKGVMALAISLESLSEYIKSLRKNSNVDIFVLLNDGTLITQTSSNESLSYEALHNVISRVDKKLDLIPKGTTFERKDGPDGNYSVTFYSLKRSGYLSWSIAIVIPESAYLGVVDQNTYLVFMIGLLALAIALATGFFISDGIATPLRKISADLRDIAQFKISDKDVTSSFIHEISVVGRSVAKMKAGLRSFSRFIPHEEVRKILASGKDTTLGGETRELTLHFSDLANFSTYCEILTPEEVVKNLAQYLDTLTTTLHTYEGTVVQYTGDGLFAFFNAPLEDLDHPINAVSSALEIIEKLDVINKDRAEKGLFLFKNRIGLHTDKVVVGNIGTESKLAYSAIGDGVNLASRLEGLNKVYGTRIIASYNLKTRTKQHYLWRMLDKVAVLGRTETTTIYEPIGFFKEAKEEDIKNVETYERALNEYFSGNFKSAKEIFSTLTDHASKEMNRRCNNYLNRPPSVGWNGVYNPTGK